MTRKCANCGKEFKVILEVPSVMFCSYECGKAHAEDFKKYLIKPNDDITKKSKKVY